MIKLEMRGTRSFTDLSLPVSGWTVYERRLIFVVIIINDINQDIQYSVCGQYIINNVQHLWWQQSDHLNYFTL